MDWILLNLILFLSLLIILWIRKRKKRFSIFKELGIPGPKPNFWLGNLKEFVQKRDEFLSEYYTKYGQIFGCFLGAKPILVITDPDIIKTIQIKEFQSFRNREVLLPDAGTPHPDVPTALPVAKDEDWKKIRTISSPSFSTGKLKKIVPIINEAINQFLEIIAEKSEGCKKFDISKMYRDLTMDITTKSELGIDTGVQRGENSSFLESASLVLNTDSAEVLVGISVCFPETEPIPTMLRLMKDNIMYLLGRKSVAILFKAMKEIIIRRRNFKEKREDILQSLIDAKVDSSKLSAINYSDLTASHHYQKSEQIDGVNDSEKTRYISLSDRVIRATVLSFVIAGFETTSSVLSFITYYLAKYQNIQDKVRDEINSRIKEENVEYEDIFKLYYLDQVISETQRLHSLTMLSSSRIASKDFKYKGITIPKGMTVAFPPYLLHRNPDHWVEPEKFDPERFSPENKSKIDPTMYQPFGNGPRNCIGMRFAQITMKFILVRLLKSYRLEMGSDGEVDIMFSLFVPRPKQVVIKAIPV